MNQKTHFGYETINIAQNNKRVAVVFKSLAGNYDLINGLIGNPPYNLWKNWYVWQTNAQARQLALPRQYFDASLNSFACDDGQQIKKAGTDYSVRLQERLDAVARELDDVAGV